MIRFSCFTYLLSRASRKVLNNKSSYDLVFDRTPKTSHFKTFGERRYYINLGNGKDKLSSKFLTKAYS